MNDIPFISIDQNSHPLWDPIPKLHALDANGCHGLHCIEDIDVAFSRQGARPGDEQLELKRERYYRGGHSDWGAALFCHDFLGRLPVDVRILEPYTGMTTAALSRLLNSSVDDLYDRWSASDNWQLVGASYSEDPNWHRVIGDVTLDEAGPFVRRLLTHAREDLLNCFPEEAAQQRIDGWFDEQAALVNSVLESEPEARLPELYRRWMMPHMPENIRLQLTSEHFALDERCAEDPLVRLFLAHYDEAAEAYNQALEDTDVNMTPLHTKHGELPFFAIRRTDDGHVVRAPMALREGDLAVQELSWPLADGTLPIEAMRADGIIAVAGKALLLVLQVRFQENGHPLALPRMGSLYMPAAFAFEAPLREKGLISQPVYPVWRVKMGFLDHMSQYKTIVRPPAYLADALAVEELPASELTQALAQAMKDAQDTLKRLRDDDARDETVREQFPDLVGEREKLENHRREIVRDPERRDEAKDMWQDVKEMDRNLAEKQAEWALQLCRLLDVHYYDSRGALMPWCIALGGQEAYDALIQQADVVPTTSAQDEV